MLLKSFEYSASVSLVCKRIGFCNIILSEETKQTLASSERNGFVDLLCTSGNESERHGTCARCGGTGDFAGGAAVWQSRQEVTMLLLAEWQMTHVHELSSSSVIKAYNRRGRLLSDANLSKCAETAARTIGRDWMMLIVGISGPATLCWLLLLK